MELVTGFVYGIIFGTILTLAKVIRFEKQISALLFKDMTIVKFMLSAIIVGSIGINIMNHLGLINLHLKPAYILAVILGGTFFGLGWSLTGYCPGTAVASLAEGRLHALFAILGMFTGSILFASLYPQLKGIINYINLGKITVYEFFKISPTFVIIILTIFSLFVFYIFEKNRI